MEAEYGDWSPPDVVPSGKRLRLFPDFRFAQFFGGFLKLQHLEGMRAAVAFGQFDGLQPVGGVEGEDQVADGEGNEVFAEAPGVPERNLRTNWRTRAGPKASP